MGIDINREADVKDVLNEIAVRTSLLEEVICVKGMTGDGTEENPVRMCSLYYTTNGEFIGRITS